MFDANFSADLTIMEEGSELLRRLRQAWGLQLPAGAAATGERAGAGAEAHAGDLGLGSPGSWQKFSVCS